LILDNHSAHLSKETKAWLAQQPAGRFEFTFTPKHGSWLNLVEGFFSKLARSVLRHIRVASKQELKDRIMAALVRPGKGHRDRSRRRRRLGPDRQSWARVADRKAPGRLLFQVRLVKRP
jgi:transposase